MEWNQDKSITLSQVCVVIFALLLAGIDVTGPWIADIFMKLRSLPVSARTWMTVTIYVGSIFAWITLLRLWKLLRNLKAEQVFISENVKLLRTVSWCCAAEMVIGLLSSIYYMPFKIFAAAAGFMALIVRIVKNVFQQAIAMKDELDLTI